jgi:biopolymer transport protein ExbD
VRYFEVRKPRIEIIPMIDIMLFLLVFFIMMAMNMIPSSGLIGNLPTSSTSLALPPPKIMIEIHQDGSLVVDQQTMSLNVLATKLKTSATDKTIISIAGSAQVSLQQLTAVMDVCHQNGIHKIGLSTKNVQ